MLKLLFKITLLLTTMTSVISQAATLYVHSSSDFYNSFFKESRCKSKTVYLFPCTLREAISVANTLYGADTIILQNRTYKLTRTGTNENNNLTGDLDIKGSLTIQGKGTSKTTIDGNLTDRILHVQSGKLLVNNLTLQNGNTTIASINNKFNEGAAILNARELASPFKNLLKTYSSVTLNHVNIKNNSGNSIIYHKVNDLFLGIGNLIIQNSTLIDNTAKTGIFHDGRTNFTFDSSLISGSNIAESGINTIAKSVIINNSIIEKNGKAGIRSYCANNTSQFSTNNSLIQKNGAGALLKEEAALAGGIYLDCDKGGFNININNSIINENHVYGASYNGTKGDSLPFSNFQVTNTTFDKNRSQLISGPINSQAALGAIGDNLNVVIENSTISNSKSYVSYYNYSSIVIASYGTVNANIINSTISGMKNSGSLNNESIGIYNHNANLTLTHVTLTNNENFAGIYTAGSSGFTYLQNSIIAKQAKGPDCLAEWSGTIMSLGGNLDSDGSCFLIEAIDLSGMDPLFGPLQANGGLTKTHHISYNSPAIDAGIQLQAITTDQRGVARPNGNNVDMGAYELIKIQLPPIPH